MYSFIIIYYQPHAYPVITTITKDIITMAQ